MEAGFREAARLGRGIGRMVVCFVAPIVERVQQGPTMWVHWGLCDEEIIRRMSVHHRDDVYQGGAINTYLLSVDGEQFEPIGRRERVWDMSKGCVLVCPI